MRDLRKFGSWWLPGSRPAFRRSVPLGQDELYDCDEPPSNREFYPSRGGVLTSWGQIFVRAVGGHRGIAGGPEPPGDLGGGADPNARARADPVRHAVSVPPTTL